MPKTVAVLVGSLREESINRKIARQLEKLAEGKLIFDHVLIGDLPFYNEDLWKNPPQPVTRMKAQVERADGVLVVSPEYNRGFPGLLANAFEWGSRPPGQSAWRGKPAAMTGVTKGAVGTAAGQQHLRLALVNLMTVVMHAPELYITWTDERFAADGSIRSGETRKVMEGFLDAFASWIDKHGA